jgi:thiosulfate dehydrogenase [quinone] large subunit
MYALSLDRLFKLEKLFTRRSSRSNNDSIIDKNEALPQESLKKLLQESAEQIASSVEKAQASQNERIEQFISYLQETYFNENGYVEQEHKTAPAIRKVK